MNNSVPTSEQPLSGPVSSRPSPVGAALAGAVRLYQHLRAGRISPCRFYPSCSQYALEALEVHGAARGTWLALRRLLRCRPFGPHGVDLVPEPRQR